MSENKVSAELIAKQASELQGLVHTDERAIELAKEVDKLNAEVRAQGAMLAFDDQPLDYGTRMRELALTEGEQGHAKEPT